MTLGKQELKTIIQRSFDDALGSKNHEEFHGNNALKASALVSNLGCSLFNALDNSNLKLNVITVDRGGEQEAWRVAFRHHDNQERQQRLHETDYMGH